MLVVPFTRGDVNYFHQNILTSKSSYNWGAIATVLFYCSFYDGQVAFRSVYSLCREWFFSFWCIDFSYLHPVGRSSRIPTDCKLVIFIVMNRYVDEQDVELSVQNALQRKDEGNGNRCSSSQVEENEGDVQQFLCNIKLGECFVGSEWVGIIHRGDTIYRKGCLNPTLVNGTSYDYLEMYYKKAMKEITPDIEKDTVDVVISIVYHILFFIHPFQFPSFFYLCASSCFPWRNVL